MTYSNSTKSEAKQRNTGTVHAAHAKSGFKHFQDRHAEWQGIGKNVDRIGREGVADLIGSKAFYSGFLDNRAGTIFEYGLRVILADLNETGIMKAAQTIDEAIGFACDIGDPFGRWGSSR